MKSPFFLLGFFLLLTAACKEEPMPLPEPEPEPEPIPTVDYADYLAPVTDAVYKERLSNGAAIPPTYWPQDEYVYWFPCFNPNDPYEIAYLRGQGSGCHEEVFTFSFRTGEATKVADNACYGLDWSSTGWLLFTGIDRKVWKVKADGDSLTQLTFGEGFHNDAKWSTDGEHFVYAHEANIRERRVCSADGKVLHQTETYFIPLGWINTKEVLVGQSPSGGLASYDWEAEAFRSVYQGGSFPFLSYFDVPNVKVFVNPGNPAYFFRYDLHDNTQDTLSRMYFTYGYGLGDYAPQTERAILQLHRRDWKDSIGNEIYFRRHLLMLDAEGNELGLVQLPE